MCGWRRVCTVCVAGVAYRVWLVWLSVCGAPGVPSVACVSYIKLPGHANCGIPELGVPSWSGKYARLAVGRVICLPTEGNTALEWGYWGQGKFSVENSEI